MDCTGNVSPADSWQPLLAAKPITAHRHPCAAAGLRVPPGRRAPFMQVCPCEHVPAQAQLCYNPASVRKMYTYDASASMFPQLLTLSQPLASVSHNTTSSLWGGEGLSIPTWQMQMKLQPNSATPLQSRGKSSCGEPHSHTGTLQVPQGAALGSLPCSRSAFNRALVSLAEHLPAKSRKQKYLLSPSGANCTAHAGSRPG